MTFKATILLLCAYGSIISQTDSCAFFGSRTIFPYYYPNPPTNGKDFYSLKTEFYKAITAQTNFNGIITVNFFINYKGETDFYNTLLCDLNYQPILITKNIEILCSQILEAIKQTSPWKPALDEQRNSINSRKFYSFKFNNGLLVEVLPK